MFINSSLPSSSQIYLGRYFLFLLGASDKKPVKLMFKEYEVRIKKGKKTLQQWREKIYLYPAILQRKWIEYKFRDRFIPSVKFDTILPCELKYNFLNSTSSPAEVKFRSLDKSYKELVVGLVSNGDDKKILGKITRLTPRNERTFYIYNKIPGLYRIFLEIESTTWLKTYIAFLPEKLYEMTLKEREFQEYPVFKNKEKFLSMPIYCKNCTSEVFPLKPDSIPIYLYKNYIPFKDYIDIKNLGIDYVTSYIHGISHPAKYKKGLIHLLNMIRLASIEDELTIIRNLFKDDPQFAYYITEKLFLFTMIPLMEDRELQKILNMVDDRIIALSLVGENSRLVRKVLKNLSKRRAAIVLEEKKIKNPVKCEQAKQIINRLIRSFFEQLSGRLVRIPLGEETVYRIEKDLSPFNIPFHSGGFILLKSDKNYLLKIKQCNEQCIPYDLESGFDQLFSITGLSESTVYFKSNMGLRYILFHIYYWSTGLEDNRFIENIPLNTVIPFNYSPGGIIFTIGAIDSRGIPHEQVLRLKAK